MFDVGGVLLERPFKVRRLGHFGLNAIRMDECMRFYTEELGYRIKLLGIAHRTAEGVAMRVHPSMVPQQSLLASVEGVYNAVLLESDFAGTVFLQGRGAGAGPTASAVVADLIDIARGTRVPVWGTDCARLEAGAAVPGAELRKALGPVAASPAISARRPFCTAARTLMNPSTSICRLVEFKRRASSA